MHSSRQGTVQQTRTTLTTEKRERPQKTNKLSCGSIHSVHESSVDVLVSFYMLQVIEHVVVLVGLYFCVTNSIVVNAPHLFTSVREFLVDAHTVFIVRK